MALDKLRPGQGQALRAERNSETESGPDATLIPVVMGDIHARIHEGVFFTGSHVELGVLNNGTLDILINVPSVGTHIRFTGRAGGDAIMDFYEDTVVSASGTLKTAINRNRFSGRTPLTTLNIGPIITTIGALIEERFIPGGSGGNSSGSEATDFEEWILDPGNYLVRITNISGVTQTLSFVADFYESGVVV